MTQQQQLWSDERIDQLFPTWPVHYLTIVRRVIKKIVGDYEADRAALAARVAVLEGGE